MFDSQTPDFFSYGFGGGLDAAGYYDSLPPDVKRAVSEHKGEIHSMDDLKRYAEKLMGRP